MFIGRHNVTERVMYCVYRQRECGEKETVKENVMDCL